MKYFHIDLYNKNCDTIHLDEMIIIYRLRYISNQNVTKINISGYAAPTETLWKRKVEMKSGKRNSKHIKNCLG